MPMPKSSTPALLLMTVSPLRAARVQGGDEVLGDAAQPEAAHHDCRAVGDLRDRLVGARQHLVHRTVFYQVRCHSHLMHPDLEEAIEFHDADHRRRRQGAGRLRHRQGARQRRAAVGDPDDLRQEGTAAGQRRQPAAARRAGRRQDVLRRHPRGDQQREVRAPPGPRRPAADRSGRLPDDQPGDRRADHRVRSAGVGRSHPARRDQPHPAEVAERVSRRRCRIARSPSARPPTSCRRSASRSRR